MKTMTVTVTAPAYWASALVNHDYSGLSDQEAAWCDAWASAHSPWEVVDVARDDDGEPPEPRFSRVYHIHACGFCPDGVTGGDVIDYVMRKR